MLTEHIFYIISGCTHEGVTAYFVGMNNKCLGSLQQLGEFEETVAVVKSAFKSKYNSWQLGVAYYF